jgi:hypothetical protein
MCGRKIAAKVRIFPLQKSFIKIFFNILQAAVDKIIRGPGIAGCLLPVTALGERPIIQL